MAKLTKGYKTGKAQPLWRCCREIRICCPNELGKIYDGLNTLTGEYEYWMCIKINANYNDNIMQRVFLP
jgi:hypothetical protein